MKLPTGPTDLLCQPSDQSQTGSHQLSIHQLSVDCHSAPSRHNWSDPSNNQLHDATTQYHPVGDLVIYTALPVNNHQDIISEMNHVLPFVLHYYKIVKQLSSKLNMTWYDSEIHGCIFKYNNNNNNMNMMMMTMFMVLSSWLTVIVRIHLVYVINTEWWQVAADLWTDLSHKP